MATLPSPRLTAPFSSPSLKILPCLPKQFISFTTRAATDSESTSDPDPAKSESSAADDDFEFRLNRIGKGKKAEIRKAKKSGSSARSSSSASLFLPPVPLKEPASGGLKVDFGFSPYSERINGRIAMLGLAALLLVELATGKSVINYHTPSIIFIQVYFVAAVTAIYVKFEKEKVSVWPNSSPKN